MSIEEADAQVSRVTLTDFDSNRSRTTQHAVFEASIIFILKERIYHMNIYNEVTLPLDQLSSRVHLASEQGRSRNRISLRLISIVRDASISSLVGTGERNKPCGCLAAATGDLELMAARVELSAGVRVRGVQSDDLVAHEIVAGGNALGDCVADNATSLHGGRRTPCVGGTVTAVLLDLEPDGAVCVLEKCNLCGLRKEVYLVPGM